MSNAAIEAALDGGLVGAVLGGACVIMLADFVRPFDLDPQGGCVAIILASVLGSLINVRAYWRSKAHGARR